MRVISSDNEKSYQKPAASNLSSKDKLNKLNSSIKTYNSHYEHASVFLEGHKVCGRNTKYIFAKTKYFKDISIKDTKYKELIYEKYRLNTLCQLLFSTISLACAIIGVEIQNNKVDGSGTIVIGINSEYDLQMKINYIFCSITTVFLIILLIIDHFYFYDMQFQQKKISDEIQRKQSGPILQLVIGLIFFIPHPNMLFVDYFYTTYNVKYQVTLRYSLNSLFMVFSLVRMVFILKFYLVNSNFYTPMSRRMCDMSKVENSLFFTLKAIMKGSNSAFNTYGVMFLVCIMFFTISIRNFEMKLDPYSKINYGNYMDVVWGIIITMSTVGLGDIYPSSFEGRILSISAGIMGICMISLLIVSATSLTEIKGNERHVYELLNRLELKDMQESFSKKLLASYCKLYKALKSKIPDEKVKEKLRDNFMICLLNYENTSKEIQSSHAPISNMEILNTELDWLDNKISANNEDYNQIREQIDQIISLNNNA